MELAIRNFSERCVDRLCIARELPLSASDKKSLERDERKRIGIVCPSVFAPERSGSYEVFTTRPLLKDIRLICIQEAKLMPKLWASYESKLTQKRVVQV
jgi:exonuclease 3'-5' domain-containing protein 1